MNERVLACACGAVEVRLLGEPMVSAKCFCDDCQAAAARFEALPGAPRMADDDHGTPFDLYRRDRYEVIKGAELLKPVKLKGGSISNRNLATCCNSMLYLDFDRGPFWISVYRTRVRGELPPLGYFIQTRFAPGPVTPPDGVKASASHPPGMIASLLVERLKMAFGR